MPRALPSPRQAGSAFFIILIGIFLFGALSFAVMQSGRVSEASLSQEQARLAAQEILAFADSVSKAVHSLRLRGCSETELSFEYTGQPNWLAINATAPADKSCHIFDLNGGKVTFLSLNDDAVIDPASDWWINGETAVTGIGTPAPELLIWAGYLKLEICEQINAVLGLPAPVLDTTGSHTVNFNGVYNLVANGIGDDAGSIYAGRSAGCAIQSTGNSFYYTLIAR